MRKTSRILLVEEPGPWRVELAGALRTAGYACEEVDLPRPESPAVFERCARSGRFDAAITAFRSAADGWILERLVEAPSRPALLVIGESTSPVLSIRALEAGADELLRKPFRLNALESRLKSLLALRAARSTSLGCEGFMTCNPDMLDLIRQAERLARRDVTLQITGEIGTGRRLLARLVHCLSGRRVGPFVEIDCALLADADGDLDSLSAGSAAGSSLARGPAARVATADGGTLLLHEVAQLSWRLQAGLLCALQGGEVGPRAGEAREFDLRLISTGRSTLSGEMESGRLRRELGYRLDVVELRIPPLRERPEDIPLLARKWLVEISANLGCEPPKLGEDASAALSRLPLHGNARDLERLMRRSVLLFPGGEIDFERLMSGSPRGPRELASSAVDTLNLRQIERRTILRSLAEAKGNRTHASRALGISTRTLRNKIRDYGLA